MKIEYYTCTRSGYRGRIFHRWRIVDSKGKLFARGERFYDTFDDVRGAIDELSEFIDAITKERYRAALRGDL